MFEWVPTSLVVGLLVVLVFASWSQHRRFQKKKNVSFDGITSTVREALNEVKTSGRLQTKTHWNASTGDYIFEISVIADVSLSYTVTINMTDLPLVTLHKPNRTIDVFGTTQSELRRLCCVLEGLIPQKLQTEQSVQSETPVTA